MSDKRHVGKKKKERDRETISEDAAAALVTSHLDHLFVRGALQVGIHALRPAVTACIGSPSRRT